MDNITLENLVLKPYYYGFKFGRIDRLNDLRKGHIYMKNLDYFIKEELRTGIPGRGDKDEALLFYSNNVKAYDIETNSLLFTGKAEVRNTDNQYNPVFCMMLKNVYENPISLNYPQLITKVSFSSKLLDDFSEKDQRLYVMIFIDVVEYFKRIDAALRKVNLQIVRNFVKYRDTQVVWKTNSGIELNDAFCKRECFSHQEEYRLLLDTKVEDHFEFNIGSIEDITKIVDAESIVKNGIKMEFSICDLVEI